MLPPWDLRMLLREESPVKEDVGLRKRKQKRNFDQPKDSLPGQGPAKRRIIVKNKDLTPPKRGEGLRPPPGPWKDQRLWFREARRCPAPRRGLELLEFLL